MDEMNYEIYPLYCTVMVEFAEDPFEVKTTESGLRLTDDLRESEDTGNIEKSDFYVKYAKIIEAGPACKYVQKGDFCYVDTRSLRPIRFKGNIYFNVAEQNIVSVIAENLTDRFKNLK